MSNAQWQVTVVEVAKVRLAGVRVHTTMDKAMQDCPKLWEETFMPLMPKITGTAQDAFQGTTYGVSVMTGEHTFDYWAAAPLPEDAPAPDGMLTMTLSGGVYACCTVNAMEQLGDAYTMLYLTWPQEQNEYVPDMQAPCFERYGRDYLESGRFEIFMPLIRR
jgi:Uncharacterized protein conserved in bacteria